MGLASATRPARAARAPLAAHGWTVLELPNGAPPGRAISLRWFDATDAVQRALRVRVPRGEPGAPAMLLQLVHRACSGAEAPQLVIELEPGARCVLLESHAREPAASLVQNLQVHVQLADGAALQHLRLAPGGAGEQLAHHVHVRLQQGATYAQCLLATAAGNHLQRNLFELLGERASVHAAGVLLGAEGALEQQVLVRHGAAGSRSHVEMLALPGAAARLVANAHTRIAAGCDDAQAVQRLSGIPVAGQPRIVLRPHLEIHHDQVQAAHGATWGSLPEDALFHARQRGLGEPAAKSLILTGLARAALARAIDDAQLPPAMGLTPALEAALARELEPLHG